MIELESLCEFILTDSGGVQKEAYFSQKPCLTLRDSTEWIETLETGANRLVGTDKDSILKAVNSIHVPDKWPGLFGDGKSGEKIVDLLLAVS